MNFLGISLPKSILVAILVVCFLFFAVPAINGIRNLGNIAGMIISAVLFLLVIKFETAVNIIVQLSKSTSGKVFITISGIIVTALIIALAVINFFMLRTMNDYPENSESTMIILGCQVKEGRPSMMLKRRLDSACEYLSENSDVNVIVSGGKGADELISEAECMKTYLIEKGISENRIFMEDKSASTYENFKLSKEVIAKNNLNVDIVVVTDGYHQLRAEMIAKNLGFENISNISAPTSIGMIPTFWVREWFGVAYYFIFG